MEADEPIVGWDEMDEESKNLVSDPGVRGLVLAAWCRDVVVMCAFFPSFAFACEGHPSDEWRAASYTFLHGKSV